MSTAGSISDRCNTSPQGITCLRSWSQRACSVVGSCSTDPTLNVTVTARLLQLVAEHPEGILRSRLVHVGLNRVRLYGTDRGETPSVSLISTGTTQRRDTTPPSTGSRRKHRVSTNSTGAIPSTSSRIDSRKPLRRLISSVSKFRARRPPFTRHCGFLT